VQLLIEFGDGDIEDVVRSRRDDLRRLRERIDVFGEERRIER